MILGIFSVEDGQVDTKKWEPYVTYRDGKKSNDESKKLSILISVCNDSETPLI